jgi:hypothetical protein
MLIYCLIREKKQRLEVISTISTVLEYLSVGLIYSTRFQPSL